MASDIATEEIEVTEHKKPSKQILQEELHEAVAALTLSAGRLFLSGLSAGMDVGFSLYLIAVPRTLCDWPTFFGPGREICRLWSFPILGHVTKCLWWAAVCDLDSVWVGAPSYEG